MRFVRFVFGQQKGQNGPIWSQSVKYFTALHSLILALRQMDVLQYIYSGMKMAAVHQAANHDSSWMSAFYLSNCDTSGTLWNDFDFGTWVFHFYLSKYYEFIDTWIILLKDKKPMFLQTFHHAGIVLLM